MVVDGLAKAIPDLRGQIEAATAAARDRLDSLIDRLVEALTPERFAAAYAQHLLALATPLLPDVPHVRGGDAEGATLELLERAAGHEVLAPIARARARQLLAREVLAAGGEALRRKALEILGTPTPRAPADDWTPRATRLLLSVDRTSLSCARYLAGLEAVERDGYGFDELPARAAGRAKRVDQVTVKFDPAEAGQPVGRPAATPGSELKAKLFVALLSLAAQAAADGRVDGRQAVRLRDLLEMIGFVLGRGTNSAYYWRYAGELTRYLLFDLPNRVVAMQVSFAGANDPLVVFERLLPHCAPLDDRREPIAGDRLHSLLTALGQGEAGWPAAVRASGTAGFELAFSPELLEALGLTRPLNALEHVPVGVLALKGPAFWLAWQVSFLRRWARPPAGGANGKPLLRVLDEAGYLARHSRGSKVRYKDAVAAWWRDVGALVGMGLLEEPGVRLYGPRGSAWREVSSSVSRALDPGGRRLTRLALEEMRVIFAIPARRLSQLEGVRRRGRRLRGAPARGGQPG
jgi:hypothetical protein